MCLIATRNAKEEILTGARQVPNEKLPRAADQKLGIDQKIELGADEVGKLGDRLRAALQTGR